MCINNTFAIAIPTRNGERFIEQTILSIINQKRKPDEIIIIDDNSSDLTKNIISKYLNFNIKFIENKYPDGFASAWNRLSEFCTSKYLTILHQDDLLNEDYLFYVEKAFQEFPEAGHLYSSCRYINGDGEIIREPSLPYDLKAEVYSGFLYSKMYFNGIIQNQHIHRCPGVTTLTSLLKNNIKYRQSAGHIADDDFFLRIGKFTDVIGISYPLASYRDHNLSVTGSHKYLEFQLSKDWFFQYEEWHKYDSLLTEQDAQLMFDMTVLFLKRAYIYSILKNHLDIYKDIVEHHRQLKEFIFDYKIDKKLPFSIEFLSKYQSKKLKPIVKFLAYFFFSGLLFLKFLNIFKIKKNYNGSYN
jgi:glycosyltransferase involved in cell wall biosynthesis